jgi:hypothetical protein
MAREEKRTAIESEDGITKITPRTPGHQDTNRCGGVELDF